MSKLSHGFAAALLGAGLLSACGDDGGMVGDDTPAPDADNGGQRVAVPAGDITEDTTWTADNTYVLEGQVFVVGATLTIEAGTRIEGDPGSVLAITRSGTIDASGTADAPIVFTSSNAAPAAGDWGGVVLLGEGTINVTGGTNQVEGFAASLGDKVSYGGTDDAHDCGTLRYVRIEYAGYELAPDNELNGLTVGACGSGTTLEYIQVHRGLDDGIELFGGTADLRHVVISHADDDGLDWDYGWRGTVQFLVIAMATGIGDSAIEADSNGDSPDALPRSAPEIWNYTFVGADDDPATEQRGPHLRRGTAGLLSNGVIAYFVDYAFDVDGAASVAQAEAGALDVQHTYFVKATQAASPWPAGFDGSPENDCDTEGLNCFDEAAFFAEAPRNNVIGTDPMLDNPLDQASPSFAPANGSPVMSGCGTPPAGFDTSATFCGAVGATDWTAGWTTYPPNH